MAGAMFRAFGRALEGGSRAGGPAGGVLGGALGYPRLGGIGRVWGGLGKAFVIKSICKFIEAGREAILGGSGRGVLGG